MNILWLSIAFLLTSFLYSSLGFGGGSTYTAILVSVEKHREVALFLSLICNITVVSISFILYLKNKLLIYKVAIPLVLFSSVGSYLGASLVLSNEVFLRIFSIVLFVNSILMLVNWKWKEVENNNAKLAVLRYPIYGVSSFIIGLLAGITSIGGGIFLAPFLHLYSHLKTKNIMAISSFFILINSSISLCVRRHTITDYPDEIRSHYPLIIVVIMGGLLGSYLGITEFKAHQIKRLTGILLLILAIRLFAKSMV